MQQNSIKKFKWQISLFALVVFIFNMISLPTISAKAATTIGAVRNADGTVTISVEYEGEELYICGDFTNKWGTSEAMTKVEDGVFSYTTSVLEPGTYEYKFRLNTKNWDGSFGLDGSTNNSKIVIKPLGATLNGDGTATFRVEYEGETLYLAGDFTEDGWNNPVAMTKGTDGVFEATLEVTSGTTYQYKYRPSNTAWDGAFGQDGTNNNSVLKVPGEATAYAPIQNGDGTVTFTYKDLSATSVYLAGDFGGSYVWKPTGLAMEKDDETGIWSITINPGEMNPSYVDESVIQYKFVVNGTTWILDPVNNEVENGNSAFTYYTFSKAIAPVINPDGTVIFSYDNSTATKVQLAGSLTNWQNGALDMTKNASGIWTIKGDLLGQSTAEYKFIVDGGWITDPLNENYSNGNSFIDLNASSNEEVKKVVVKYVREDKNYDGWTFYTWSTGKKDGDFEFKVEDGIAIAEIPVGDATTAIGFKIRKDGTWTTVDFDSDRYIPVDKNALVTKATVTSGVGDVFVVPAIEKPVEINNGQFDFKYRNTELYNANNQTSIDKVELMIKYGSEEYEEYEMQYQDLYEYFDYSYKNIKEGTYTYKYAITIDGETTETDEENIIYTKRTMSGSASVSPEKVDYDDNAVVSLKLSGADAKAEYIKKIYMDLTEVGGPSEVEMDINLLEDGIIKQTIGISDKVTTGKKNIPISIVDVNGEEHNTSTTVTVVPRVYDVNDNLDFGFDESSIYFMVTDRFFNGDTNNDDPNGNNYDKTAPYTYHGGDFAGITKKIPYLKELGINTIWITPIVEQTDYDQKLGTLDYKQYSYHGYWAKNFTEIDPHLGTIDDFKTLIDTAHDNGIKIMVDVVLNHSGYGMNNAQAGSEGVNNYPTDEDRSVFEGMFREKDGGDIYTNASSGLPDFRTEDPEVRAQLIEWQSSWLSKVRTEKGNTIDYYRVDTVKHVENTTWKAFKTALAEIDPDFKMIGEFYGTDYNSDGEQLECGQMDSVLDFGYKTYAKNFVNGSIEEVSKILDERADKLSNTYLLGQFLSSHDEDGFITALDGDVTDEITDEDRALALVGASLQITDKGTPVIYYGEEVGLSGANNFEAGEPNRYDMDFTLATNDEVGSKFFNHYSTLLKIRSKYSKVFAKGDRTTLVANNEGGYTAFSRSYNGTNVVTMLNIKDKEQYVQVNVGKEYAGQEFIAENSKETAVVDNNGNVKFLVPAASNGGTVIFAYTTKSNENDDKVVYVENSVSKDDLKEFVAKGITPVIVIDNANVKIKDVAGLIAAMNKSKVEEFKITVDYKVENQKAIKNLKDSIVLQVNLNCNLLDGELGTDVEIELEVDDKYNGKTLYMYYLDNNGKFTLVGSGKVVDGIYSFSTNHFSDYVLLDKKIEDATSIANGKKTGDMSRNTIFALIGLLAVSGCFIIIPNFKKEEE